MKQHLFRSAFLRPAYKRNFLSLRPISLQVRLFASNPDRSPPNPAENESDAKSRINNVADALKSTDASKNNLLAPVHIPEDPNGVIKERHPATSILANSAIVIQRELEMMNIMIGFEQANKYVIHDPQGNHVGFMAEQELGMGNALGRQFMTTHRPFTTHVFDRNMKEVLRFRRPFTWFSSRITVYDPVEVNASSLSPSTSLETTQAGALSPNLSNQSPDVSPLSYDQMRVIGEAQRQWAPLRRKYNLFLLRDSPSASPSDQQPQPSEQEQGNMSFEQFAYVDEPFLSWDFSLMSSNSQILGSVNRNFTNFGREIFTDTGCYALRMDAAGLAEEPQHLISKSGQMPSAYVDNPAGGMSLDQRAVMLATAVSVDFDFFSRNRQGMFGGGMFPLWMGGASAEGAGGAAAGGAAAGEAAGAAGASEVGAAGAGTVARAGGASGAGEGAMTGAATMAGYEAMQRGAYGQSQGQQDDASPVASNDPYGSPQQQQSGQQPGQDEEVWGETWDFGDRGQQGQGNQPFGGDQGGEEDGGSWLDGLGDFFDGDE